MAPALASLHGWSLRRLSCARLRHFQRTQGSLSPKFSSASAGPDQPMSLKWEFPGGKIEAGETAEQALTRELDEELGIAAVVGRRIAQIRHKYRNGGAIDLQFFVIDRFGGELVNRIFNDMQWAPLAALPAYDFLAADLDLIRDLAEGKLL